MVTIAGIDGCGSRWLVVSQELGTSTLVAGLLDTGDLVSQTWSLAAIDIPIGLPDRGAREADIQARRFIQPRGSSVFPSPIRPALFAQTWREACDITHAIDGRKISQQTFGILPKIRGIDDCIRSTSLRDRLFEVHPEVCFAAWQGGPMLYPKRDPLGHEHRRNLICAFFGQSAFESVAAQIQGQKVAADDIADALAALWTAHRLYHGTAARLPVVPEIDGVGLPMCIWY